MKGVGVESLPAQDHSQRGGDDGLIVDHENPRLASVWGHSKTFLTDWDFLDRAQAAKVIRAV
jgi:hypothetical protein